MTQWGGDGRGSLTVQFRIRASAEHREVHGGDCSCERLPLSLCATNAEALKLHGAKDSQCQGMNLSTN